MPSGKVHATIASTVGVAGAIYILDAPLRPEVKAGALLGLFAGWAMTPDLDIPSRTYEETRLLNWIPLFGRLWVTFWAGYGQFFHHRGVSHWPVIGTLTRMFWLVRHLVFFVLALGLLSWMGVADVVLHVNVDVGGFLTSPFFVSFAFAWMTQDLMHEMADGLVSGRKRQRSKRKSKKVRRQQRQYAGPIPVWRGVT